MYTVISTTGDPTRATDCSAETLQLSHQFIAYDNNPIFLQAKNEEMITLTQDVSK